GRVPAAGHRDHRAIGGAHPRDRRRGHAGRPQVSLDDLGTVLPEAVVTATACLVLLADTVLDRKAARLWLPALAVVGLVGAAFSGPFTVASHAAFGGFVVVDTFTAFFRVLFIVLAIFAVVVSPEYLERRRIPAG